MGDHPGLIARIAGTPELIARLDEQDRATKEHRRFEAQLLGDIKDLAVKTDSRVDAAETQLGLIADREATAEQRKARGVSLKQGLIVAVVSGAAFVGLAELAHLLM